MVNLSTSSRCSGFGPLRKTGAVNNLDGVADAGAGFAANFYSKP